MKNNWKEILLVLVILAAGAYLFLQTSTGKIAVDAIGGSEEIDDKAVKQKCETQTFTVNDEWMEPDLKKGSTINAVTNWEDCGLKIEKGQIVFYKISNAHEPVARIVAGKPGDTFVLSQPEEKNFWQIEINGDAYMESREKRYHFGSAAPPALKIYEQAHRGRLDPTSVVLLSKKSPGDQDSGSLGVLNVKDILAVTRSGD